MRNAGSRPKTIPVAIELAGVPLATVFMRGAAPVRLVSRDVSPRFGQRVAALCLEVPLDGSLEALTIIVPAAAGGSPPMFDAAGVGSIAWSDAAGRHRVVTGAPRGPEEASQLPQEVARNADLLWWVEDVAQGSQAALLAAMPAFAPCDAQVITDLLKNSGKMMLWTHPSRCWAQLPVEQPRRG